MNALISDSKKVDSIISIIKKVTKKKKIIPLHDPSINNSDLISVNKALKSRQISTYGNFTNIFEKKIKKYTKSNYVVATINGTSAIHISLILAGVKQDDEVLLSTLGFVSSVNAVSYLKAKPHFVDCDEATLGVDPVKLDLYLKKISIIKKNNCINKKNGNIIRALIVTHVFGNPCKIDKIFQITKKYKIKLIEDSAEALGSWYKKKHLGTFGDFGVLSFNGNKIITTGGGGAILLKNLKIAKKAFHITKNMKIKSKFEQEFQGIGFNYRLPSLNAALGCSQIDKLPIFLKKKKILNTLYYKNFNKLLFLKFLKPIKQSKSNNWLQAIILNKNYTHLRGKIMKRAHLKKIEVRPVWKLLHRMRIYKDCQKMNLDNALSFEKRIINIPSSQNLINERK
jgi:perosamine synthetase